jgi:flagellar hook-associated protein 1 FlgK
MSLADIMNIATSGLQTAQQQLRIASDNITNVNTPGYIRKTADQQAQVVGGVSAGVTIDQVRLAADKYLESAQFNATSSAGQADAAYNLLDQIQSQFGDLTNANSLFNQAASALSSAATAAEDPSSTASRQQVLANMSTFLGEGQRIAGQIQNARAAADTQIAGDVQTVNGLLQNIAKLNTQISAGAINGDDITGAQTQQTSYIQQLSKLIDVATSTNSNGSVTVRTQSGMVMVNNATAVSLSYTSPSSVSATTAFSPIVVTTANGETRDLADNLSSGELKGLIDVRDRTSVAINDQLNQYMAQFANAVNAAHNASSATPAPASLTGKNLAQTVSEAVTGFKNTANGNPTETNLVTLDGSGNIVHKLTLDFSAAGDGTGTWSLDGTSSGAFSAATFASDLTSAFGGAATVAFTNGQLSITASGTGNNKGVAVVDPPAGSANAAATKVGESFSQFFGLNDLITSSVPTTNKTGLTASSNAGFTGGTVNFSVKSPAGGLLTDVAFAMPSSGTMGSLISALNNTTTGLGSYGTFALDQNGALTFTGFGSPGNTLAVTSDSTSRLASGGPSFSQFFGLGGTASTVATALSVNPTITNNPSLLSLAQVNLSPPAGQAALLPSDGSGGTALSNAGNVQISFAKTGLNPGGLSTLSNYGADLAGQVGNLSANAKTASTAADALLTEATSRRNSSEGVNLDEELVNLTTYQQAYSASGRLVQAASDMFTVLMNMMGT